MSAERDQLITPLSQIEAALVALAAGRASFIGAHEAASRAASAGPEVNRQITLEAAIGVNTLDECIRGRLKALGCEVLYHHRGTGMLAGPTWVSEFSNRITGLVP